MRIGSVYIFKERPGVISPGPLWVCIHDGYMYTGDTLVLLLREMWSYWKHDRNLVG